MGLWIATTLICDHAPTTDWLLCLRMVAYGDIMGGPLIYYMPT